VHTILPEILRLVELGVGEKFLGIVAFGSLKHMDLQCTRKKR